LHPETVVSRHFDSELISCTLKLNDPTSTTTAMMQPQSFSPQATAALTGIGVALDTMRQILATPAAHSSSTLTFISTNLNQLQTIVSRIVAVR
jgi:hypothetical protein